MKFIEVPDRAVWNFQRNILTLQWGRNKINIGMDDHSKSMELFEWLDVFLYQERNLVGSRLIYTGPLITLL